MGKEALGMNDVMATSYWLFIVTVNIEVIKLRISRFNQLILTSAGTQGHFANQSTLVPEFAGTRR